MKPTTRRDLLQNGAALGLSLLVSAAIRPAHADPDTPSAPTMPTPSLVEPAIYNFKVGVIDAFVIHDGVFANPGVQPVLAPEAKPNDLKRLLEAAYQPTDRIAFAINVLVLRDSTGVTLVDSGAGSAFGASAGRLMQGLTRLNIAAGDIRHIVITHAHGDHVGGLLGMDGAAAFPNAVIHISQTERDFWLGAHPDVSGMKVPAAAQAGTVQTAVKYLTAVAPQLKTFAAGDKIGALTAVETPGHTPGHTALLVASGADSLLAIGDAVHSPALQFPRPDYTIAFDVNPTLAVATRRRLFVDAAKNRTKLFAYHLPFPGVGHVRANNKAYEWVPAQWEG